MLMFRSNPWAEMRHLHRSMDHLFNQLQQQQQQQQSAGDSDSAPHQALSTSFSSWHPSCDVRETEEAIIIHADIPGVSKDDISLSVDRGVLTISGSRHHSSSTDRDNWHVSERQWGSFSRSIRLPSGVDVAAIDASHNNGVLEVVVPKPTSQRTSTRIAIRDHTPAREDCSASSSSCSSTSTTECSGDTTTTTTASL